MSNDAALRGGAALVMGRDAASVWYNPAAIAATRRLRIDAAATAYGLRITRVPAALEARADGRTLRAAGKENQTQVVPTAATVAFGWPERNFALALSFHTPVYSDIETRVRLSGRTTQGNYDFEQQANALAIVRRHHFGLTLAWEVARKLRFGATFGALFDKDLLLTHFSSQAGTRPPGAASEIVAVVVTSSRVLALEVALGVQAELTRWLHAGASLRSPAGVVWLQTAGSQSIVESERDADGITSTNTSTDSSLTNDVPGWLTPWTVATGLGVDLKRAEIEINAEASPSKQAVGEVWRRQAVWNVRLGGSVQVAANWILGAGVFTDRTTQPRGGIYPTVVLDRWGGSFAVRYRYGVRLARRERARRIVFATTIAARYAFGIGSAGNLRTTYPMSGPESASLRIEGRARATQHLVTVHVGTGMSF
jgi:long-subunit fatty acid transport protein